MKFRNAWLDLVFAVVAETRESPISQCSYVGSFRWNLHMQMKVLIFL